MKYNCEPSEALASWKIWNCIVSKTLLVSIAKGTAFAVLNLDKFKGEQHSSFEQGFFTQSIPVSSWQGSHL